jgi:hypothetical protein
MMASRGKPLTAHLHDVFVKVGSFYPLRENFRLTPEVKAKFTDKLETESRELFGCKVAEINRKDEPEAVCRWIVGLLSAFRYQTGGAGLLGRAQRR